METNKISSNVEFDVIYADGARKRVPEGILFGVENERMIFHNGTMRPEVIIAVAEAAAEVIGNMHLPESLLRFITQNILRSLGTRSIEPWIPVAEELPAQEEVGKYYAQHGAHPQYIVMIAHAVKPTVVAFDGEGFYDPYDNEPYKVSHWMELPPAPEAEQ